MKKKQMKNKMMLNKETVASLDNLELRDIRGGGETDTCLPMTDPIWICKPTFFPCESVDFCID